jgi:hypothetical protein
MHICVPRHKINIECFNQRALDRIKKYFSQILGNSSTFKKHLFPHWKNGGKHDLSSQDFKKKMKQKLVYIKYSITNNIHVIINIFSAAILYIPRKCGN